MVDVWSQLATFAIRVDRSTRPSTPTSTIIELKPAQSDRIPRRGAALLKLRKLDEARAHAELAAEWRPSATSAPARRRTSCSRRSRSRGTTSRRARAEAKLAREADPTLPLPTYIDARLLYDQGKYAEALPLFEQAIAELNRNGVLQINELHFYTADTLGRLERYAEAEAQFIEELKYFPQNSRARAGLAMLYQASGRPDAAAACARRDDARDRRHPTAYALTIETLKVLKRLMDGLAPIEGRKSVLLMSEGFVADETWPLVTETEEAAARANTRIYTLDGSGSDWSDNGGRQEQLAFESADATDGFVERLDEQPRHRHRRLRGPQQRRLRHRAQPDFRRRRELLCARPSAGGARWEVPQADGAGEAAGRLGAREADTSRPWRRLRQCWDRFLRGRWKASRVPWKASTRRAIRRRPTAGPPRRGRWFPSSPMSTGIRARPDAASHLALLGQNAPANAAATAGWEAYSRGDLESARSSLTSAAADASARPWVHYALGHTEYARGDHANAIAAWERVLAASPEFEPGTRPRRQLPAARGIRQGRAGAQTGGRALAGRRGDLPGAGRHPGVARRPRRGGQPLREVDWPLAQQCGRLLQSGEGAGAPLLRVAPLRRADAVVGCDEADRKAAGCLRAVRGARRPVRRGRPRGPHPPRVDGEVRPEPQKRGAFRLPPRTSRKYDRLELEARAEERPARVDPGNLAEYALPPEPAARSCSRVGA